MHRKVHTYQRARLRTRGTVLQKVRVSISQQTRLNMSRLEVKKAAVIQLLLLLEKSSTDAERTSARTRDEARNELLRENSSSVCGECDPDSCPLRPPLADLPHPTGAIHKKLGLRKARLVTCDKQKGTASEDTEGNFFFATLLLSLSLSFSKLREQSVVSVPY